MMMSLERLGRYHENIGGWLRNLGLERYEPLFIENAIDSDVLAELTEGDLEKLGIPMGDRKRLIKAVRAMLAGSPTTFTGGVGEDAQSRQPRVAAAERRHLTVMICDLVGSTALSAAPRSGGHARRDRCLSRRLRPYHANL